MAYFLTKMRSIRAWKVDNISVSSSSSFSSAAAAAATTALQPLDCVRDYPGEQVPER